MCQGRGKAVCDGNHENDNRMKSIQNIGNVFIEALGPVKRNIKQFDVMEMSLSVGQRSQRFVLR